MKRPLSTVLVALAVGLPASTQAALPPIPDAELSQMAALIVDARVTATACGAVTAGGIGDQAWTEVEYVSTLMVEAAVKGKAPTPLQYRGTSRFAAGYVGPDPAPALGVGWVGRLYLSKAMAGGFSTTYGGPFSAREETVQSRPAALPPCPLRVDDGGVDGGVADAGADADADDARPDGDRDVAIADVPRGDVGPADVASADAGRSGDTRLPVFEHPDMTKGCSCDAGGAASPAAPLTLLGVLALALATRRSRRR